MYRGTQEKEQLIRKFEEIVPFLKTREDYGWIKPPPCDPRFDIIPVDHTKPTFKKFTINVKTGWHSEIIYYDSKGVHRIKEGVTAVDPREWRCDYYSKDCSADDGHKTPTPQAVIK